MATLPTIFITFEKSPKAKFLKKLHWYVNLHLHGLFGFSLPFCGGGGGGGGGGVCFLKIRNPNKIGNTTN